MIKKAIFTIAVVAALALGAAAIFYTLGIFHFSLDLPLGAVRFQDAKLEQAFQTRLVDLWGTWRQSRVKIRRWKHVYPLEFYLTRMEYLSASGVNDLTGLQQCRTLRLVELGGGFSDISSLGALKRLERVTLCSEKVEDIAPLTALDRLEELELWRPAITVLPPLGRQKKLRKLRIEESTLQDISGLAALGSLTELTLVKAQIQDLTPLKGLGTLTALDLSHNQVKDIRPLATLSHLTSLSLAENQVRDLAPRAGLTRLQSLDFRITRSAMSRRLRAYKV